MALEKPEDYSQFIARLKDIGITIIDGYDDIYQKAYTEDTKTVEDLVRIRITEKKKDRINIRPKPRIKIRPHGEEITEEDQSVREMIDIQSNDFAKTIFIDTLRRKIGMDERSWFSSTQLIEIANKLNLPFIAIADNHHWHLVLRQPTMIIPSKEFGVWVYDPIKKGERFLPLNWTKDAQINWQKFLDAPPFATSKTGKELAIKNKYNLSIKGESEVLQGIKGAPKQFDGWNCGPICLFQAMLLAAVIDSNQTEFEVFRERGLKEFESNFGIDVLTREEILSGQISET